MIRITCKQDGFWRAGIRHTRQPAEYPDDAFSDDQLALLTSEPMLTVELVDDGPQADPFSDPEPDELVDAIGRIPAGDPQYWTGSGMPKTSAMEEVTGRPVSAAERDRAWELFRARANDGQGDD